MTILIGTIQKRHGTAADWTAANPVLLLAEEGYETDTGLTKTGDGVNLWNALPYDSSGGGGQVDSVVGTENRISVDNTDPVNPIVNIDPVFDASKADRQSELLTGGVISVGTYGGAGLLNDIRVTASTFYIVGSGNHSAIQTDFLDITLSTAGNQRYVGLYGTTLDTITKVEGAEAALASYPNQPANTALIGYVLVGDASIGTTPDLSGYLPKADKATATDIITGTEDAKYITPLGLFTGGAKPLMPIWSGKWRGYPGTGVISGTGWNGAIWTTPYYPEHPHTVTKIRIPLVTGAAGNLRLALYNDLNGYPTSLIEESGNLSAASSGEISFTFTNPVLLTGKVYHMAIQVSSAAHGFRWWNVGSMFLPRTSGNPPLGSYSAVQAFGSFPLTFPVISVEQVQNNKPMLELLVQ